MMVSLIPEEALIEKLETALAEYKIFKNEKMKEELNNACTALLLKLRVGNDIKAALEYSESFQEMQRRDDIFNPGKG